MTDKVVFPLQALNRAQRLDKLDLLVKFELDLLYSPDVTFDLVRQVTEKVRELLSQPDRPQGAQQITVNIDPPKPAKVGSAAWGQSVVV